MSDDSTACFEGDHWKCDVEGCTCGCHYHGELVLEATLPRPGDEVPWPRCQHVSEVGNKQCIRVADGQHTEEGLHSFGGCSWCAFTYEPCPVHEPTASAAHKARESAARARVLAARDELRSRAGELPEWAQQAIGLAL